MFVRFLAVALFVVVLWAVVVGPSEGAGRERTYVVRAGDTLWTIAASHYGGDPREAVWKLQQRNGLDGTMLHPGQRLFLPSR